MPMSVAARLGLRTRPPRPVLLATCGLLTWNVGACATTAAAEPATVPVPIGAPQAAPEPPLGPRLPELFPRVGATDDEPVSTLAMMPIGSRRSWLGAGAGFVVGGTTTWIVLHHGGSTAHCDQDANQDAWSSSQCLGASVLGGLVGAGIGALLLH